MWGGPDGRRDDHCRRLKGLDQHQAAQRHDEDLSCLEHIVDPITLLRDPNGAAAADDHSPAQVAPALPKRPNLQVQVDLALVKIGNGRPPVLLRRGIQTRPQTQYSHRTPPSTGSHLA
jgi:hypothetical protein